MRSVRLPPNLLEIPARCFLTCFALPDISIPKLVRAIRQEACYSCTLLRSIDLSNNNNLQEVGDSAFTNCTSLTSIRIRSSSSNLRFGDSVFEDCFSLSIIKVYPWLFLPKLFEATNDDPSFIYKFFHRQISASNLLKKKPKFGWSDDSIVSYRLGNSN